MNARSSVRRGIDRLGMGAIVLACSGCGSGPAPPATPPEPAPAAIPLVEVLPSPGLQWLLQLRTARLWQSDALRQALSPLIPDERLAAYVASTGVDPARIDDAWFARYQLGSLWLFDAREVGHDVERLFAARSWTLAGLDSSRTQHVVRTYVAEGEPGAFLHWRGQFIAIADRDPSLAKIVRASAQKRLVRTPTALATIFLAPLATLDEAAMVRGFAVGPFPENGSLNDGLVSGSFGANIDGATLHVRVHGLGAWELASTDLADAWRERISALLDTPELRTLGASERTSDVDVQCVQVGGADQRTRDLRLCHASASFALDRALQRVYQLTRGALATIGGDRKESITRTPLPVPPSGSD